MNKRDLHYFKIAREISKTSTFNRIKIGAIIVYKKEILSVEVNVKKTHPLQKKYNSLRFECQPEYNHYLHAELRAIINSSKNNLQGANIYVFREDLRGRLAPCRPCPACMEVIKKYGIKKIFYTTEDGYCEEMIKYD
jgi:deoxycytidylate deaminase